MCRSDSAINYFSRGFNCSQAVLAAFCEDLGVDLETALKVSCGFGGGMRMGETCGAVTGAFMVIGLKYGHWKEEDKASKEKTYAMIREIIAAFKDKNNTVVCKELLGYDISTEEGMKMARENGCFKRQCPRFIKDAVELLEGMV